MIVTPEQIARYLYCPLLPESKTDKIYPKQSLFESCVRKAIIGAEHNCALKDSEITPRKILRTWDSVWWPASAANQIDFKEAQELTIKASSYFMDYCKYDISDFLHPTIATDIESQVNIGSSILKSRVDLMKVDLTMKEKNILLVDLSKKGLKTADLALDISSRATALGFSQNKNELIQYVTIDINEDKDKLFITNSVVRPSELEDIYKLLSSVEYNIRHNVTYGDRWKCKECQACPSFKYLMKEDILLRQ